MAVGRIRASFPNIGLQREYAEVAEVDPEGIVTSQDLKEFLLRAEHRYLARQVCWTLTVQSVDVCQVVPRHDADLDELIEALGPEEDTAVQVLVAEPTMRSLAPACWMPELPAVALVQMLSFELDDFVGALGRYYDADQGERRADGSAPERPSPRKRSGGRSGDERKGEASTGRADGGHGTGQDPRWQTLVRSTFLRLTRRVDATGFGDEDRARTYVAVKDGAVYALLWNALNNGQNLVDVSTRRIVRAGRQMVAVRLTLRHRQTQVIDRYERLVDIHDVFCFAVGSLTPVYE